MISAGGVLDQLVVPVLCSILQELRFSPLGERPWA